MVLTFDLGLEFMSMSQLIYGVGFNFGKQDEFSFINIFGILCSHFKSIPFIRFSNLDILFV
jgi:hypothetical protein